MPERGDVCVAEEGNMMKVHMPYQCHRNTTPTRVKDIDSCHKCMFWWVCGWVVGQQRLIQIVSLFEGDHDNA